MLPDMGEISVSVFKFLLGTPTGELPRPLEHAAVQLDWGRSAAGGLLSPGPGDGRTRPAHRPRQPPGPAPYGWCQNNEG
jgi:hypothetical protein